MNNLRFYKKTWSIELQGNFFIHLAELLDKGFSLNEAMNFLTLLFEQEKVAIESIQMNLSKGNRLEEGLKPLGFSETVCSQVYLAQKHGNLVSSLKSIGELLIERQKQTKKIIQTLLYPMVLLVFVFGILGFIRTILLPQIHLMVTPEQLDHQPIAKGVLFMIEHLEYIGIGFLGGVGGILFIWLLFLSRKSPLQQLMFYLRVPIINTIVVRYYSFLYSREFSYFLANGQSIQQMVHSMQEEGTTKLTKEIAREIEKICLKGESLSKALEHIGIFKDELILLIVQGELTQQLEYKLLHYSRKAIEDLIKDIERKMAWIQPILFIGVGLLIIAIYMAILLPTMSVLEGGTL